MSIKALNRGMATPRKPRLIYNDDSCTLRSAPPPHSTDSISLALDYLEGSQVDCLCWLMGDQFAYSWPSKVMENVYDLKDRHGDMRRSFWKNGCDAMYGLHKQGIDYLPILIERARARGLQFMGSFRMNDAHLKSYPTSWLAPEFWKKHQDWRLWEVTDARTYYNAALDYSFPEVRRNYLNGIFEVAETYDVDGIELDFMRNPYLFQPSEAWRKRGILTRFIREVRGGLERIGRRRGRALRLILRIPSREETLTKAGIDAKRWIADKLSDILVVSEKDINLNQTLEPWLSLCRRAGVLLYPAVETGPAYNHIEWYSPLVPNPQAAPHHGNIIAKSSECDLNLQRAAAQNLLAQKPDGIYLFNFPCRLAEGRNILHNDPKALRRVVSVLGEIGSLKTLARKPKHYCYYEKLPIHVEANRPRRFHQTIDFNVRGGDVREARAVLRFRQVATRNPHAEGNYRQSPIVKPGLLRYYLNDREIPEAEFKKIPAPADRVRSGFKLPKHEILELRLPGAELRQGCNQLAFEMPKDLHPRDPYIYIYDLELDLTFNGK